MKDSGKLWTVQFVAVVCVFIGVHASLEIEETQHSVDARLSSIESTLNSINEKLAESPDRRPAQAPPIDAQPQLVVPSQVEPEAAYKPVERKCDEREGTQLPLPGDGFVDHSQQLIDELGDMDARVKEFRESMSEAEKEIFETMKEEAFNAAFIGNEFESLNDEELAKLKEQVYNDPAMAAFFIVAEEKILRQMVIDKAVTRAAGKISLMAVPVD